MALTEVEKSESAIIETESCDEKALFCGFAARVLGRAKRPDAAARLLSAARGYALCSLDQDTWAQVSFLSALVAAGNTSPQELDELLAPALISSAPQIRAQALEWKSILLARAGDRAGQSFHLEQAWGAIASCPSSDEFLAANILFNCALLAFELCDRQVLPQIADRMTIINWGESQALQRFHVMRHAAWAKALDGDHLGAFALWRESAAIAPSAAWKVLAFIDRAYLAREMGEHLFAREELSHALAIGESVAWEKTNDQERLVLLGLAEGAAYSSPSVAKELLGRYQRTKADLSIRFQLSGDALLDAPEAFTTGLIAKMLGDDADARKEIHRAFVLWSDAGYRWRASQAAVRLLELGEATDQQRAYLADHAPMFPNSWIAARARDLLGDDYQTKDGQACKAS